MTGKRIVALLAVLFLSGALFACTRKTGEEVAQTRFESQTQAQTEAATSANTQRETQMKELVIKQGARVLRVDWEENESVEALRQMAAKAPVQVDMSAYGGFEQVGALGRTLPNEDRQMTTEPGDIVLYAGNQLVIFYGSNSWSYTKLGHIRDLSQAQLADLLAGDDVSLSICLE